MSLREYKRKRHFAKTPEPAGATPRRPKEKGLRFVVQKHDATRLHYDLRLEWEGVLKSWAVPKGPCLDPKEKRLAVEVEDHPLEYATFEGQIPEGEYGAGEVIVWDRGTWTPEKDPAKGFQRGQLEFSLAGEKLQGRWVLVRTRGRDSSDKPSWLLIKRTDDAARPLAKYDITADRPESVKSGKHLTIDKPTRRASNGQKETRRASEGIAVNRRASEGNSASTKRGKRASTPKKPSAKPPSRAKKNAVAALPDVVPLQLATLASSAPSGGDWVHEVKFDGYRMLCRVEGGKAKLITRNEQDWTHRYRSVAEAAARLPIASAMLDGEVVAQLPSGASSFQALQNAAKNGSAARLLYYAFDLLYLNGEDLRRRSLMERKALLAELLAGFKSPAIAYSEHFETSGPTFLAECCRMGLEGVISKRRDRPYLAGRTGDWIKAKCLGREELVIGGFTLSTAMKRGIGAILVGFFDGGKLIYAGRVGTGFSESLLVDLRQRLESLKQEECPFASVPARERGREVRWVRPELVAEVEFTAWTEGGILRHPSFQGLREDKPPREVSRPASLDKTAMTTMNGKLKSASRTARQPRATKSRSTVKRSRQRAESESAAKALPETSVRFTSPDRVLYADMGLTKLGLANYYAQVAEWMLPHVVDRPLSLVRCPKGQQKGQCFYQKHAGKGTLTELGRVAIEESDGLEDYVYIQDLDSLLALVQMNVLEIHPWGSRRDNVDRPDRLILDLDPDPAVPWSNVVDAAREVRELLTGYELESYLKTTGGKGLHVVVPIAPRRHDWSTAKAFTRRIAEELVARAPDRYIATMSKAARKGKIFVDYLRNDHGATAIAAYSTRARAGAPVSVPLTWDELSPALRSDHFHVGNLPSRLASIRRDPWRGIDQVRQTLPRLR